MCAQHNEFNRKNKVFFYGTLKSKLAFVWLVELTLLFFGL